MTTGDVVIVAAIMFLAFKETIMGQVHYAKKRGLRYVRRYRPILRAKIIQGIGQLRAIRDHDQSE